MTTPVQHELGPSTIDDWHAPGTRRRVLARLPHLAADAGTASLHERRMRGYQPQDRHHIMGDDIVDGADEPEVLLLGHEWGGWWTGSRLDIHRARTLIPGQNATTLQVAASVLGVLRWLLHDPNAGLRVPDDPDHDEVLAASPCLGERPSAATDRTPHNTGTDSLTSSHDVRTPPTRGSFPASSCT